MRAQDIALDDRREIWRMLDLLPPAARLRFLSWACSQAQGMGAVKVKPGHDGSCAEVYYDIMLLEVVHGLNLNTAACRLERLLRRGR